MVFNVGKVAQSKKCLIREVSRSVSVLVSNYPEAPSLHYAGLPRVLQPGHQVVGDGELGFQVVGGHLQWTVAG